MKAMKWVFPILFTVNVFAGEVKVIELMNFRRRLVDEEAFELRKGMTLRVEAWGTSDRREWDMLSYGWILDAETREVVWEMTVDNSEEERRGTLRHADEEIRLQKGKYEIYYAASPSRYINIGRDIGDVLEDIFGGSRSRDWRRDSRDWSIIVYVDERDQEDFLLTDFYEEEGAVVRLTPMGDDQYERVGFTLAREAKVRVYAIGEGDEDEMYDYGWIVDATSNRTVWEMDYYDTDRAGGAEKNRMIDEEIILSPGDYLVHYVTDGSHSNDGWNALPPYDPRFWGITIWGVDGTGGRPLSVKPYEPDENRRLIVDLTRVGDDEFWSEGFTLKQSARLFVRAMGEYGSDDRFVDYGWILDARTREPVWEMTRRNTKHAGGGRKNRLFEGFVNLDAGDYEVYYISDGSHSYRDWNTGPPYDPRAWGIAVYAAEDDFDQRWVEPYDEADDPDVLVKIVKVQDYERIRESFRLSRPSRVRVYAIGEGDDDNEEMYDYGWIEDERGRRVWEMDYWDTDHAGGALKNRMINTVIRLEAGEYTVHYRSDGSHSYEDWNMDPPRDPVHWGIMVRIER